MQAEPAKSRYSGANGGEPREETSAKGVGGGAKRSAGLVCRPTRNHTEPFLSLLKPEVKLFVEFLAPEQEVMWLPSH